MEGTQKSERPILAITMGDAAGIGPEIAVRALADSETYRVCRPLLIGDGSVVLTYFQPCNTSIFPSIYILWVHF